MPKEETHEDFGVVSRQYPDNSTRTRKDSASGESGGDCSFECQAWQCAEFARVCMKFQWN